MAAPSKRCATLMLTPERAAIFSQTSATEGLHRTLGAPTGQSLLGYAAAEQYGRWAGKAFDVFHSGKVRFSDALPLTPGGEIAFPLPRILTKPKNPAAGETIRVGHPPAAGGDGGDSPQHEALKARWVLAAPETKNPKTGWRQRTAIENGRARTGALFGFQQLEPEPGLRYIATIEADPGVLEDAEWSSLCAVFGGSADSKPRLHLGRYANSGYGGSYRCEIKHGVDVWPTGRVSPVTMDAGEPLVFVWALSDLDLADDNGMPDLVPGAHLFGLDFNATPDPRWSAVSRRRYAPWNGHLNSRDVERQVIAAGSVLAFRYAGPVGAEGPSIVGASRAGGCGRVWVSPPLLAGAVPNFASLPKLPLATEMDRTPATPEVVAVTPLSLWANSRKGAQP